MFLADVLNSTAIRLTWNEPSDPNGVVLSYHLDASVSTQDSYITETGLEGLDSTLGNGDLREFVLTGLHPYVQYVFRLSAATSIGQGNATLPREPMTPEAGVCGVGCVVCGCVLGLCSYCCVGSFKYESTYNIAFNKKKSSVLSRSSCYTFLGVAVILFTLHHVYTCTYSVHACTCTCIL